MFKTAYLMFFVLLFGCQQSENLKPTPKITPNTIPILWQIEGRMSVRTNDNADSMSFLLDVDGDNFSLKLTTNLGLGRVKIRVDNDGFWLNEVSQYYDLKTWMLEKHGWYFPLKTLTKTIFLTPKPTDQNWHITTQNHPKIINLTHKTTPIKIKIIIQNLIIK